MLRMKHRDDTVDEARIRDDERRRVMAEMRGDGPVTDEDWRTTPPPVEDRVDDPRAWDVPDDRHTEPAIRHDEILERRPWVVEEEQAVTERGFSPGQILVVLAGAAALALGIVAVARTGLDGSLSQPVEPVLGWDHTALLGLFEIGAGLLMILGGLRAGSRWFGGLIGLAVIAGGILIVGRLQWTIDRLGAEHDFGWVAIVIGAVAVVGAAIPRIRHRSATVTRTEAPAS
jgi:hypothetical protein